MIQLPKQYSLGSMLGESLGGGIAQGLQQGQNSSILKSVLADVQQSSNQPIAQQLMQAQSQLQGLPQDQRSSVLNAIMSQYESSRSDENQRREESFQLRKQADLFERQKAHDEALFAHQKGLADLKMQQDILEKQKADELEGSKQDVYMQLSELPDFKKMTGQELYKKVLELGKDRGIKSKDAAEIAKFAFQQSRENRLSKKDLVDTYSRRISDIKSLLSVARADGDFDSVAEYTADMKRVIKEREKVLDKYDKAIAKGDIPEKDSFLESQLETLDFEGDENAASIYERVKAEFGGKPYEQLSAEEKAAFEKKLAEMGYELPEEIKNAKPSKAASPSPAAQPRQPAPDYSQPMGGEDSVPSWISAMLRGMGQAL